MLNSRLWTWQTSCSMVTLLMVVEVQFGLVEIGDYFQNFTCFAEFPLSTRTSLSLSHSWYYGNSVSFHKLSWCLLMVTFRTLNPFSRVTNDLLFQWLHSEEWESSRDLSCELEPCMFDHILLKIVHYIVNLSKIFARKENPKSMHMDPISSITSAIRVKLKDGNTDILVPLRLPCGNSPCPNEFFWCHTWQLTWCLP